MTPRKGAIGGRNRAFADRARAAGRRPEQAFQDQVVELAKACGWLVYHTHNSERSEPGFPDLVMIHRQRVWLVFAELKVEARVTDDQKRWQHALLEVARSVAAWCGQVPDGVSLPPRPRIVARVWRPEDWAEIEHVLTRRPQGR